MAVLRLSRRAETDLLNIGAYTLRIWGVAQADRYLDAIEHCCLRIARNPLLGRSCEEIRTGLRRMEQGRHVIFYRQQKDGILIARVLHQSMLPERHGMQDEDLHS